MTKKTLYDDELFDKWFKEVFQNPPPKFEYLVKKRVHKNKRARRKKQARQRQKFDQKDQSPESEGISTDSHNKSSSSSTQSKQAYDNIGLDSTQVAAKKLQGQLEANKQYNL